MKTSFAILGFFTLLMAGTVLTAQERPFIQSNTVYAGASGRYESAPDTAVVQFSISAQEKSPQDAYDRASRSAEQVREILRSNGIDPKQAEIGYFSLQPVYDYQSSKRKLEGYRVNSNVSVKIKDFSKLSGIEDRLAGMDVTGNQSISYTLEDIDAAKVKASEDAFRKARALAAAIARAGNRTLGELVFASVDVAEPIRPFPVMARAETMPSAKPAPTAEFSPQKITITADVNALFALK
ncbi:MAG TPA: SIMPL domain-containing protein [Terriglobales bacterium]|nr:SIMPL domain-containing protein [Terriglobales bacterium]